MSVLSTLPDDALLDILIFCSDDLRTIMRFASTCSVFWNLTMECADRLWIFVLMRLRDTKQSKGFKSSTLSILDSKIPNKSKQLLTIVRTQTLHIRKHDIILKYRGKCMMGKFRYIENLKIHDPYIDKMIKPIKIDSLKFSPQNIIKEQFNDSPIYFINNPFPLPDIIDALFKKNNANLQLDIKKRTMSSSLYNAWKEQNCSSQLFYFRYNKIHFTTIENTLLFLKLLYLEFPNSFSNNDKVNETGYEQEKHTKRIFKRQLNFLKDMHKNHRILGLAIQEFEKQLYDL